MLFSGNTAIYNNTRWQLRPFLATPNTAVVHKLKSAHFTVVQVILLLLMLFDPYHPTPPAFLSFFFSLSFYFPQESECELAQ